MIDVSAKVALRQEDLPDAAEDADQDEQKEVLPRGRAPAEHARREPQDRRQQRKVEHDRAGLLARGQAADLDRRARRAEGPDEREERPGRRSSGHRQGARNRAEVGRQHDQHPGETDHHRGPPIGPDRLLQHESGEDDDDERGRVADRDGLVEEGRTAPGSPRTCRRFRRRPFSGGRGNCGCGPR